MTDDLSRRQLFTEALPRGIGGLIRSVLQLRQGIHEWAGAEAAPLHSRAAPSSQLVDLLRELDESMQRLSVEHPWFPDDMPDPRDRDAFERGSTSARTSSGGGSFESGWSISRSSPDRAGP